MDRSRSLVVAVSIALAAGSSGALGADGPEGDDTLPIGDWVTSSDGRAYAFPTGDEPGGPGDAFGDLVRVERTPVEQRPPLLGDLPAEADLYSVDLSPGAGPVGLVRLQSEDELSFTRPGQTPAILRANVREDGVFFLDDQRIVDLPPGCDAPGDTACLDDGVLADLTDRFTRFSIQLPPGWTGPSSEMQPRDLIGYSTIGRSGVTTGFGGGIFVETDLVPEPDTFTYTIVSRPDVTDLFGGEPTSVTIDVYEYDENGALIRGPLLSTPTPLDADAGGGLWMGSFPCPADGRGVAIIDTRFDGAGSGLADALGPGFEGLAGGTPFVATTVLPFVCAKAGTVVPVASLGCIGYEVVHELLRVERNGRLFEFPTYIDADGVIWIIGGREGAEVDVRLRGGNAGRPVRADVGRFEMDQWRTPPTDPWQRHTTIDPGTRPEAITFEARIGVERPGRKRIQRVVLRTSAGTADLTDQVRDALDGDAIRVRFPQTDSGGTCPPDLDDLDDSVEAYPPVEFRGLR